MLGKGIEERLDVRFGMPRRREPNAAALSTPPETPHSRSAKPALAKGLQQIMHVTSGRPQGMKNMGVGASQATGSPRAFRPVRTAWMLAASCSWSGFNAPDKWSLADAMDAPIMGGWIGPENKRGPPV